MIQKLEIEISALQEALVDCELTIAERVEIREEIAELEAELAFAWAEVAMENASRLNAKKSKKKFAIIEKLVYLIHMNKTELNQKFEELNRLVNSLPVDAPEFKQAWKARFEVAREFRNFRELGGSRSRLHDMAFKIREQNA